MRIPPGSTASIAASGMRAGESRLEASAQNVANVSTDGYTPLRSIDTERREGGVSSRLERAAPSLSSEGYAGLAPAEEGLRGSAVDLGAETVQRLVASRSYSANARVLETDDAMQRELIRARG